MPAFGTGTDGFGGSMDDSNAVEPYDYRQEYRHEHGRKHEEEQGFRGRMPPTKTSSDQLHPQATYQIPAYERSPQSQSRLLGLERENYSQGQLHQYPPHQFMDPSPRPSFMGDSSRPSTPGFYPDRAPKLEKLTGPQREIVKEFPTDLDEENGSLMKTAKAMLKDWRSWVKWKYTREYDVLQKDRDTPDG
jgi:hypothetical protein